MADEVPMIVIGEPNKSNLDKLYPIFKKLGITGVKERIELEKYIKNHPNSYGIIELLDELGNMQGCKNTFENRYKLFTINRDLKQLGSPLFGENLLTYDDLEKTAHEYIQVSREDIIKMHIELRIKQGRQGAYLNWYPTKRNIRTLLSDLLFHDVIMSYAVEDLFNDITDNKEWVELVGEDQLIRVLKIY